ncbi:MAG: endonuclease MutS2 [Firmicutes bacterium]|nr:endonuclease MutS2 [Bacillota bacterium]
MNEKTCRILEYHKIKALLKEEASSAMAKAAAEQLRPSKDIHEIRELLAETGEALTVIMTKGPLSLGAFYDIGGWINLADKGGVLTMKQLLEVLYNLQAARSAYHFLQTDLPELPVLQGLAEVISIQRQLEDEIDRCIISEDEMADNASSELRTIRRKIALQNESIRSKMNSILNSAGDRNLLQDSLITMRQGRYVIPVKQEHRGQVPGIIHDQSATGATLFIEPQAIVNMNNELRELELAEKKEIQRILAELSASVAEVAPQLQNNQRILIRLDFIFAKGKLAARQRAGMPLMNDKGILDIREGRHPLIDPRKVVPISVALGRDYDTLIITGPNTGGKTVTLKTVGLFVLMAQSGLYIPAGDRTEMPVFEQVFADIGDEQSIEQSLSTFSSHMKNIVDITSQTGEGTLVLLDELGAGTDPTEGAALAISILDHLYGKGAKTLATTHYTELKKFALSTPGVENASMEFDVETLSPTYRLTIGLPGKSNAFEISKKLGLDPYIIEEAKGLLGRDDLAFEDVLTTIEADRKAAEEERDEAIYLRLEMQKQKEALDREKEKLAAHRDRILEKAREEARDMVQETKELMDQIQKELRQMEKQRDPAERNRTREKARQKLKEAGNRYREEMEEEENRNPVSREDLKVGDRVRLLTLGQKGTVLTLPDAKGELQVQVGALKVNVNLSNLEKVQGGTPAKKEKKANYGALFNEKVQTVVASINVVGKNLDEAEIDVDKYLDDAFMAGLKEVSIIHGRGAGILREGLARMFKTHAHVKSFRRGHYNEGGDGVTIVTLKQ